MGRPSWCDTCKPTGTRCERCEARRLQINAGRLRNYEKTKTDPAGYALHLERSKDGMTALRAERLASGLTTNGRPLRKPLNEAQAAHVEEMMENVKRQAIPRCENCPPTGRPCAPCRTAYCKARHAERMATDPEYALAVRARTSASRARVEARKRGEDVPMLPPGRTRTRARCENCPPTGDLCATCMNAYNVERYARSLKDEGARAKQSERARAAHERRKARAELARLVLAGVIPNEGEAAEAAASLERARAADRARRQREREEMQVGAPPKEPRAPKIKIEKAPAVRTIPRCAECPPTGKPCNPCYNAYKRQARTGSRDYQPRERARVIPSKPRPEAEVLTVVIPRAERADLDFCSVCMRRGRWGGRQACDRHAEQVAPPPGWKDRNRTASYTAGAKASQGA